MRFFIVNSKWFRRSTEHNIVETSAQSEIILFFMSFNTCLTDRLILCAKKRTWKLSVLLFVPFLDFICAFNFDKASNMSDALFVVILFILCVVAKDVSILERRADVFSALCGVKNWANPRILLRIVQLLSFQCKVIPMNPQYMLENQASIVDAKLLSIWRNWSLICKPRFSFLKFVLWLSIDMERVHAHLKLLSLFLNSWFRRMENEVQHIRSNWRGTIWSCFGFVRMELQCLCFQEHWKM